MLSVLCSGTLVSDPRQRTSTAGKAFATCQMRVPAEDAEATLVSVICFNADTVAAILALQRGDSCAIARHVRSDNNSPAAIAAEGGEYGEWSRADRSRSRSWSWHFFRRCRLGKHFSRRHRRFCGVGIHHDLVNP